ncbi:recombinase family protein [Legionella dresdenensis]|uniref:Recombinase family protein n=1 Tax=Legionella dresdenensis TaxID=450200 RepID=A0ABV8CHK9_9GAMM
MSGKRVGYIRVSSFDQNPERQLDGIKLDKTFIDKASGKDVNRPQLEALLAYVRDGDTVVVHSMDRLARNLIDLRNLVNDLTAKDVSVEFIKENLTFSSDNSPMAILLLSVMGAFAEFERALLKERQREGIELAKKRGAYPGRKKILSDEQVQVLKDKIASGAKKAHVASELGISRETLYQYLRAGTI